MFRFQTGMIGKIWVRRSETSERRVARSSTKLGVNEYSICVDIYDTQSESPSTQCCFYF